jgi:mono/diheme cytochrome c family protein
MTLASAPFPSFRHAARALAAFGAPFLLAACVQGPAAPTPAPHLVSAGERIAQQQCGECHAIGPAQASPLADAPSFASLRPHYSRADMALALRERMTHIHPRMPRLRLEEDEVDRFLDYWQSLGPGPSAARGSRV